MSMTAKQETTSRFFPQAAPSGSDEADESATLLPSTGRQVADTSQTLAERIWNAVTRDVAESNKSSQKTGVKQTQ